MFSGAPGGADHARLVEVAERVGLQVLGDLPSSESWLAMRSFGIGEVDAVVAGETVRRTTDADVDFLRPGVAQVHHARARRGAAHDRVIDDDHALARDALLDDVELHLHAELARELRGIEEGAPDVVVADEGGVVGDARFLAEAERGVVAGVGHGDDEVGIDRVQAGELAAHVRAHLADVDALERAVGPREVDVLENAEAEPVASAGTGCERAQAVLVDDDDFARLDVADEFGAGDDVERAALAREHPRVVDLADAERAEAERIAHADDFALAQEHERKRAVDLAQRLDEAAVAEAVRRLRHEMQDDLAVDRRLENRARAPRGRARSTFALTRLPLWPMAIWPREQSTTMGWAFSIVLEPVVE